MADVEWTNEQKQAIERKDSNILVAAAAGSGKTAVLVERMIHKILDEGVNIDEILIVTFTNAAASEMRERILDAIYKKMETERDNLRLSEQIVLLNKASICTIHAFCLEVIRNYFYEIDASANFRIADTAEIDLLSFETIEDLFEEHYEKEDKAFQRLLEVYTDYRSDDALKELILKIYTFVQSMPFPKKWLAEKVEELNLPEDQDFAKTSWGKIILADLKDTLENVLQNLNHEQTRLQGFPELAKFSACIAEDIQMYENLQHNLSSWENAHQVMQNLSWGKWPVDRKVTSEEKYKAKDIRDDAKGQVKKIVDQTICFSSKDIVSDIATMYPVMQDLKELILEFMDRFADKKKEKNIVDFHDIEHFALKILLKEDENGNFVPTEVAKDYQKKFQEIAIDEYQDSNLVQEYILKSVSKGNNVFMVGDVKQSIYRFRQARPELFLEKYQVYGKDSPNEQGLKIQLFKNFRSRKNILDITNLVFETIMSKELGDIEYNEEEYLNLGASYLEKDEIKPEDFLDGMPKELAMGEKTKVYVINTKEEAEDDIWKEEEEQKEEKEDEQEEPIEDVVIEARFVASQIEKMIAEKKQCVWDKKEKKLRNVIYRDIAILLRSTSSSAPVFEKELQERGIPVFTDTGSQFLDSIEIQTMLSLLKVIDNPMQDIPLVTVLRSSLGGFTDNDLVQIRASAKGVAFYEAMQKAVLVVDKPLRQKIEGFFEKRKNWKQKQFEMSLDEFLWDLYEDTGFYHICGQMPDGALRQANLKILFEKAKQYESSSLKGLFQFIRFVERLHQNSGDFNEAKIIGENENVVRIMSIHKSKGLEFPIVFGSGLGKKFNMQDTTQSVLLHQEYGFGVTYKDIQMGIEYQTLTKEAIKKVMQNETISEEMRILYVLLTRAKEQLILTGTQKNSGAILARKEQETVSAEIKNEKISVRLRKKSPSFLELMELVYFAKPTKAKEYMDFHTLGKKEVEEIIKQSYGKKEEQEEVKATKQYILSKEQKAEIEKQMNWEYPYEVLTTIPNKTSVTHMEELFDQAETSMLEGLEEKEQATPKFLQKEQDLTPQEIGTLMHLCIQKMDEKQEYTKETIEEFVNCLAETGVINEKQKMKISQDELLSYTKSDLFQELKKAKKVEKEIPFYCNIPVQEIYPEKEELAHLQEAILVQGVIDLYYVDKDDKLVLVDYKTDFVKEEEEIKKRYQKQLSIYQKALEKAYGKKVDKVMLCLIRKNAKCIELDL